MSDLHGLHLHIDCASGAAGDMMLGALLHLGVPLEVVGDALDAIGAGRARLRLTPLVKSGIAALDIKVDTTGTLGGTREPSAPLGGRDEPGVHDGSGLGDGGGSGGGRAPSHGDLRGHGDARSPRHREPQAPVAGRPFRDDFAVLRQRPLHADPHPQSNPQSHSHSHSHSHPHLHELAHHHYADLRARIVRAALTDGTKRRALDIFDRIARAEAKLHGKTVEDVVFHEVGAIDSVVDIVGTAAALDWLGPRSVSCASVAMGHGTLTCAHGVLPVPAPAALEVLREANAVMADGGVARELCTPTGAAILAATVTRWSPAPVGRPVAVGYGAGDAELADRPNVLRAVVLAPHREGASETVWQIDANLDDMSPELCGPASEAVFAAGALDVWWTPIMMKKGRPAIALSALVEDQARPAVIAAILRETTTIGLRFAPRERVMLARRIVDVATRYGVIPVKLASDGDRVLNAAPEYEPCAAAARHHGVPVKLVFAAALAAYDALD